MKIKTETLLEMYRKMNLIRLFEERTEYYITRGMIHGPVHLYIGEEASAVGACSNLERDDYITSTHRGHGHSIAKGADVKLMFAELMGKADGYCRGKGGSMHIADLDTGNLGANGIVGGGAAIATGAALTIRMQKLDRVVVCFFGDGALNQGVFHESINLAAVWNLPVIYFCENNQYAMSLPNKKAFRVDDLAQRSKAYGIPGKNIDGNDVIEVFDTVRWAKKHVKKDGPVLLISNTYRFKGHAKADANRYRTKDEILEWQKLDPIPRLRGRLIEEGLASEEDLDQVVREVQGQIEQAETFALNSSEPSVRSLMEDVYA